MNRIFGLIILIVVLVKDGNRPSTTIEFLVMMVILFLAVIADTVREIAKPLRSNP